ncbi:MAG: nucleotide exchange factor GrpE [Candidatus Saccharimonadales bacterium]|jgi:molecular chaperone GrpE
MTKKKDDIDYRQIAEQLAAENAQITEALQRERADAVNLRRRHEEQVASLRTTVKASLVKDLLPIIDNFERSLKHVPSTEKHTPKDRSQAEKQLLEWVEGVRKVIAQFEKTLADIGVERIQTVGEPFNPRYHEAVSMEEGDGDQEMVSEELQSGYRIGEDVIRHAMVRVKS